MGWFKTEEQKIAERNAKIDARNVEILRKEHFSPLIEDYVRVQHVELANSKELERVRGLQKEEVRGTCVWEMLKDRYPNVDLQFTVDAWNIPNAILLNIGGLPIDLAHELANTQSVKVKQRQGTNVADTFSLKMSSQMLVDTAKTFIMAHMPAIDEAKPEQNKCWVQSAGGAGNSADRRI